MPISRYEQGVVKHIFKGAFHIDSSLDLKETFVLLTIFGAMLINLVTVYINLIDMPQSTIPFIEAITLLLSPILSSLR